MAEWLSDGKHNRVYLPEEPFLYSSLILVILYNSVFEQLAGLLKYHGWVAVWWEAQPGPPARGTLPVQ